MTMETNPIEDIYFHTKSIISMLKSLNLMGGESLGEEYNELIAKEKEVSKEFILTIKNKDEVSKIAKYCQKIDKL